MAQALAEPADVQMVWTTLQEALQAHYAAMPAMMVNKHKFYHRNQEEGETINQHIAALQKTAAHCKFSNIEEVMIGIEGYHGIEGYQSTEKVTSEA